MPAPVTPPPLLAQTVMRMTSDGPYGHAIGGPATDESQPPRTETPFSRLPKPIERDTSLMKWESLNRILGTERNPFNVVDQAAYDSMNLRQRKAYNSERIKFMAGGMTVTTGTINSLIAQFLKADMMNDGALAGRRGVMLSAPASSGKSTACLALIEYYLSLYESENPGAISQGAVPVIYTSVPATRTIKGMLQRIARFLALPFQKSDTETDLSAMLQEALPAVGTKLIVLDEVQMLNGAESTARPAVNNLKDLTNYFEGTIVYSGLNLTGSGLLFGDAGLQLKRRVFNVNVIDLTALRTEYQRAEWSKIVGSFAKALPLYATNPSAIQAEAEWLHMFTGGAIGTLKAVLFDAAAKLIFENDPSREILTRELLEESVRDYAAESGAHISPPAPLEGARNRQRIVRATQM